MSEKQAITYGQLLFGLFFFWLGFAPTYYALYLGLVFLIGTIKDAILRGLMVKLSMDGEELSSTTAKQGNLQGTLSSINTLASAFGSLIVSQIFSWSLALETPMPWLVFFITGGVCLVSTFYYGVSLSIVMRDYFLCGACCLPMSVYVCMQSTVYAVYAAPLTHPHSNPSILLASTGHLLHQGVEVQAQVPLYRRPGQQAGECREAY